jgi:glycosyltransferase involved in cell wall biosynthesis
MKVLYITSSFSLITHTFITREVDALRRRGIQVDLLSLRPSPPDQVSSQPECDLAGEMVLYPVALGSIVAAKVRWLAKNPRGIWRSLCAAVSDPRDSVVTKLKLLYKIFVTATVAERIMKEGYEHIHAHFASDPATYALYLHLLTGIPFSFTGHAADIYRDPIALLPKLKLATGLVAISQFNLDYYRTLTPELRPHRVVHCGIDLGAFPLAPRPAPDDTLEIFALGRLVEKKGFRYLIEAVALLRDGGVECRARIAGPGPLLPELEALTHSLRLADRVTFPGSLGQDQVKDYLRQAHVFALPAVPGADGDVDGIPVVLMEAMALGCPVVSTRVSGIPELVRHEETGLLVDPADPQGLATALARLAREPELGARLSASGRQLIERDFNIEVSAQQLEEFFRHVTSEEKGTLSS